MNNLYRVFLTWVFVISVATAAVAQPRIYPRHNGPLIGRDGVAGALTATGATPNKLFVRKDNLSASTAPTVNEDSGDGYQVGSLWLDTTADKAYVLLDATVGAAVWTETTTQGYWTQTGSDIYYDSGKVGIGTTTPDYLVDVVSITNGKMKLENTGDSNTNFYFKAARTSPGTDIGAFDGIWAGTETVAAFSFAAGTDAVNKDDGRIDLWTQPSGGVLSLRVRIDTDGAVLVAGTTQSNADTTFLADGGAVFNQQGNDTDFRVEGVGEPNALFVQGSDGKVGIGTTTPDAQLQVDSGADGTVGIITKANSPTTTADLFQAQASDGTVLVNVSKDGNVGIGTNPDSMLHLYGSGKRIHFETTDSADPGLVFTRVGANPSGNIIFNSGSLEYYAHAGHKFSSYLSGGVILRLSQASNDVWLPQDNANLILGAGGADTDGEIRWDGTNTVYDANGGGHQFIGDLVTETYNFAADSEASDTYAITLDPAPTAYTTGMMVTFTANTANTGACTLNVNSLGAKSLKAFHDQDPPNNYIEAGSVVLCCYDGTNFQLLSPDANP